MADRAVDRRLRGIGEASARINGISTERVMYMTIDGMDQAKFKVPRNLSSSKEFESCWRPQVHLVGLLVPGVAEMFFLVSVDTPADSNLTMTLLAKGIERAEDVLRIKGLTLPEHLVLLASGRQQICPLQHTRARRWRHLIFLARPTTLPRRTKTATSCYSTVGSWGGASSGR